MSPSAMSPRRHDRSDDGRRRPKGFWALTLGCIGVVYGDIGTARSTRCASRCWRRSAPVTTGSEPVVLGILSLIIWALLLVVTAKYVLILLRADNNGEGGTLALMALASRALRPRRRQPSFCSASSAGRCFTAMPSSRRRCRCCRRSKA